MEPYVKDHLAMVVASGQSPFDIAINLCLYYMKTQIYGDGNKRAAVLFANHFLIGKGEGLL